MNCTLKNTLRHLNNQVISPLRDSMKSRFDRIRYQSGLLKLIAIVNRSPEMTVRYYFTGLDERLYLYALSSVQTHPELISVLPRMPDENVQFCFTGKSGADTLADGLLIYQTIKKAVPEYDALAASDAKILDFGCGWGRIARFFLKDFDPSQIYGVDIDPEMIRICNESNLNGTFSTIGSFPPIDYPDGTFSLIYLYSVFSHLSESACNAWMSEFRRLLKPGGVVVASTRPRSFIELCERTRLR